MKISIPVILLDEALKFVARNYIDGNHPASAGPSKLSSSSSSSSLSSVSPHSTIKELILLILSWLVYALLLISFSDEIVAFP